MLRISSKLYSDYQDLNPLPRYPTPRVHSYHSNQISSAILGKPVTRTKAKVTTASTITTTSTKAATTTTATTTTSTTTTSTTTVAEKGRLHDRLFSRSSCQSFLRSFFFRSTSSASASASASDSSVEKAQKKLRTSFFLES